MGALGTRTCIMMGYMAGPMAWGAGHTARDVPHRGIRPRAHGMGCMHMPMVWGLQIQGPMAWDVGRGA